MNATIITVTHNRHEDFERFLPTIKNAGDYHWIVVDSGSDATMLERLVILEKKGVISRLIIMGANVGAAKAINFALEDESVKGAWVKLDPDIIIEEPNWLENALKQVETFDNPGIVGLPIDQSKREGNLAESPVLGMMAIHTPALFEKCGGYWPKFGFYGYEDCELDLRARLAGFNNYYLDIPHQHLDDWSPMREPKKQNVAENEQAFQQRVASVLISKQVYVDPSMPWD